MSYSEQIRHPDGALNPQGGPSWWWWLIGAGIAALAALILVAIFRPAWLTKIGVNLSGAGKALRGINPRGWV